MNQQNYYYGFDMGGTKIELSVFDNDFNLLWKDRVATPKEDYPQLIDAFVKLTLNADNQLGRQGLIGIGIPGIINPRTDNVFTTNVDCAKGKRFIYDLESALGRKVKAENDANCFALSEAWHPDFQHDSLLLGIILGTGVGAGLIFNKQVISGFNGITGEIGHMPLPDYQIGKETLPKLLCGCGKSGCGETYLSGRGFEWLFHHYYQQHCSAIEIITLFEQGDERAIEHVDRFCEMLAQYLANIIMAIDPAALVFGGGLSNFAELYHQLPLRIGKYLYAIADVPKVTFARYGSTGGGRGAALLNRPFHEASV